MLVWASIIRVDEKPKLEIPTNFELYAQSGATIAKWFKI
jgi:hypothetical protein